MAAKVDMSLDDIISTNKVKPGIRRGGGAVRGVGVRGRGRGMTRGVGSNRGRGAGAGQAPLGGNRQNFRPRGNVNGRWNHDMYQGGVMRTQMVSGPAKLLISNLDFGVSDSDIHELFAEFGAMRNAAVHYDRSGRSLGTAHVVFERHADGLKASKQYNGVHLDGRPMNITLEGGAQGGGTRSTIPPVKRLYQGPRPVGGGFVGGRGGGRGMRGTGMRGSGMRGTGMRGSGMRGSQRGTRGTRGTKTTPRGGGRGRGFGRGARTKVPTAEELDAELDAYVNQVNK